MNPSEIRENESQGIESRQPGAEQPELEENYIRGAEILEEAPNGSFMLGLQTFIAWVQSLVGDKKRP